MAVERATAVALDQQTEAAQTGPERVAATAQEPRTEAEQATRPPPATQGPPSALETGSAVGTPADAEANRQGGADATGDGAPAPQVASATTPGTAAGEAVGAPVETAVQIEVAVEPAPAEPAPDAPAEVTTAVVALLDAVAPLDAAGLGEAVREFLADLDAVRAEVEAMLPETEYAIVLLGVAVGVTTYEVTRRRRQGRPAPIALATSVATEPH